MNRFQIKEIRDLLEYNKNGFFVEEITDDYISATHLDDETGTLYKVFPNEKCPECESYLLFNDETAEFICLNKDCLYTNIVLTPPQIVQESIYSPMTFIDLDEEQAFKESTLGLILDDENK